MKTKQLILCQHSSDSRMINGDFSVFVVVNCCPQIMCHLLIKHFQQTHTHTHTHTPQHKQEKVQLTDSRSLISSVQFSRSVMSYSLWPRGVQHARLPCPSSTSGACSNSCPLSWWCHPTISSSVFPSSSCLQSFPASGSFPMSQFFASGDQSIGGSASASVLSMNIQDFT